MRAPVLSRIYNKKGFTIIEVMIVLAVASLIMLIVFLAVPALQRNARNTNRTADATKIATAVNECLSNKNNTPASCDQAVAGEINDTLDGGTIKELTTRNFNLAATAAPAGTAGFPASGTTNTANIYYNAKCSSTGDSYVAGSSLSFVVLYNNETTTGGTNRCISA